MLTGSDQIIEFQKTFTELGQSCMNTALRTSEVLLEKSERFIKLELEAIKEALEDNRQYAKKLSASRDASEYAALSPKFNDAAVQKAMTFWSKSYDIAWQAQTEVTDLAKQNLDRITKDVMEAVAKTGNGSPAAELTMSAIKSATEAVNQTLSSMTRAVKQVSEVNAAASAGATGGARKART